MLTSVEFAELQPGDLGDGVGFVGRLERAREERLFLDRLRGELGINAGAAQKEDPFHPRLIGRLYEIRGDHEVVVEEVGGPGVVGVDTADFGGGDDDGLGPPRGHEIDGGPLVAQVEFGAGRRDRWAAASRARTTALPTMPRCPAT